MAADYGIVPGNIWAAPTETIFRASNLEAGDQFGSSVAISGNYAIVGTGLEDGSSNGTADSGAAYIFEFTAGGWNEKQILRASNLEGGDQFGGSVAISGNYAIVGARLEDGSSTSTEFNGGAAYIFERDTISGNWIEKTILRASNLDGNDYFGISVAISGNYAIVGARSEDGSSTDTGVNSGAAYIFERDGSGNWTEKIILRASNLEAGDYFGQAVAISGNYVIVGAYGEDGTSNFTESSGAAYIFERNAGSGNWTEKTILRASNLGSNDQFGGSVAISGNYVIVGTQLEDGSSNQFTNSGAAYIFERDGSGNWTEKSLLRASNLGENDRFGNSVSISGNYAIVGARIEDGTSTSATTNDCGAAYIFERDGSGNWAETKILRASNLEGSDFFGQSVAISGNYVIVGAQLEDGTSNGTADSGAAYIYSANVANPTPLTFVDNKLTITNSIDSNDIDVVSFPLSAETRLYLLSVSTFTGTGTVTYTLAVSGGANVATGTFSSVGVNILSGGQLSPSVNTTYVLTLTANASITYTIIGYLDYGITNTNMWRSSSEKILRASNLDAGDNFGQSVAISGNYAIVGANGEDGTSNGTTSSGAVYIFERNTGTGAWSEKQILRASNLEWGDNFGISVAISGNYAIVGAYREDGSSNQADGCGAAYIFERDGSGNWIQNPTILRGTDLYLNDYFGMSVSISGNYAIVGAYRKDRGGVDGVDAGVAYIFERNGSGNWIRNPTILTAIDFGADDNFGISVSISGNYAIVGAPYEDGTSISATTNNCGAAYIFERDGSGNWNRNGILRASNLDANDWFGYSVAISGNYAIVGAWREDGPGNNTEESGAAYIFERISGTWTETSILRASDLQATDYFGSSVAIDGTYAIVGAYFEDGSSTDTAFNCGAVYIFERDGSGNWKQNSLLRASNLGDGDNFGGSVAISGTDVIVGAQYEDGSSNNISNCGAAYIFSRTDYPNPTPLSFVNNTLTIANGIVENDTDIVSFVLTTGTSLFLLNVTSFTGTGTVTYTLAVSGGANVATGTFSSVDVNLLTGVVLSPTVNTTYILTLTANAEITYTIIGYLDYGTPASNIWAAPTETILRASNLGGSDFFGDKVAISGNYAIVGAYGEDGSSNQVDACGAAYIFELNNRVWSEKQILRASNLEASDHFGTSVAISGNYAIVGAWQEDGTSNGTANSGAAYIFERDGSGNWTEKTILRASNLDGGDQFGSSVAISGNYAIVGAYREDGTSISATTNDCGAAYIFERDGSGNWAEKQILRASNLGALDGFNANDDFGVSVAISGNYAIVGANSEDGSSNQSQSCGAAYIFERDGSGNWAEKKILRASNLGANDQFGKAVAISGNYVIVGAIGEDGTSVGGTTDSCGAAYIFERDGSGNWAETKILRASNLEASDHFGRSVAISGNYAIVGATGEAGSGNTTPISGAAYIFERDGSGNWAETKILRASNLGADDNFGWSVAISGNYAIVGAIQEDENNTSAGFNSGAAYIYTANLLVSAPLSFVNNTLTITNSIDSADGDAVSFVLSAGSKLYPFRVTNFSGTGTITYTLSISGGSNVLTGTFSANNFDLLAGTPLSASVNTTYVLTLTADAAITYTIFGRLFISPANILVTPSSCLELKPIGTTVGTLTCNNLDNDLITYSVSDTANFSITGSTLKTNTIFDFERVPSYTVTITASIGGLTSSNSRTISVTNISGEAAELRSQNLQGLALKTAVASQINPLITIANLKAAGYTLAELIQAEYTYSQLLTDFSNDEIQALRILPRWSSDASANRLIKSYVKDFVDVSGMVALRENSNLYISGNTETAGSLSFNRLFVTADASFNRRIFVGGDVSMNGTVTVSGDLSMNGSVTKCSFNNSSIPKSAFTSTVPDGPDYNTSKIVYDQTFQANDDVSMNGATFASNNVIVSGNIVFGDGTIMNTADNNILSINPTVFNSSTFTSLDICGNLVAGSYATSSDYRIKTNVVELDETYTVDKLRPVKYFQTQINREKYGLIAHELQEHYPDLVIGTKDGSELQRVNYTGLIAILINDIKRMKRELEVLELQQR